jgi:hypothetical protein
MAMQHSRNMRGRRLATVTPPDLWEQIELECGPLDKVPDDLLRHHIAREATISGGALSLPPVVALRVLDAVIALCGPNVSATDKTAVARVRTLLRKRRRAIKPRRPFKRPRRNWAERGAIEELCRELKELTERKKRERGPAKRGAHEHVASNAKRDAAREIAIPRGIPAKRLLSWAANPGRRRRTRK